VREEELVAAGVRAVEEQEAVALRLDLEKRPHLPVNGDRVAQELGHPERVLRVWRERQT
jgi:hypothetical protein